MNSRDLRQKFLKFFEKNGHKIVPSSSLVPSEEEQLTGKEKVLFTSAGMQPLIPYLMGKPHPQGKKLVDVQKCLRTDDIEQVGDHIHHTFFEMLGNWSLGAYWKNEAIRLSFEFLTKELAIPIEKLAITTFTEDEESAQVWKSLGIPQERIFYFGKEHNWWPTGEKSGPCGPDTEMFYWTGNEEPEGKPNENPIWVEIWNDVFMEFNRKIDGTLEDLPQKNVDTGMGLERMLAVINGKDNNYQTDLFEPIIEKICQELKIDYKQHKQSIRIIADHIKAAVFLIKDGVIPSNKLQGYILRRLLRRVIIKLNKSDNDQITVLGELVLTVINIYKDTNYFEEMDEKYIKQVIWEELDRFKKTLDHGLEEIKKIEKIDGKKAFDLYQTYGFPYEVTEEIFREKGQEIDHNQFEEELKKHQAISRGE